MNGQYSTMIIKVLVDTLDVEVHYHKKFLKCKWMNKSNHLNRPAFRTSCLMGSIPCCVPILWLNKTLKITRDCLQVLTHKIYNKIVFEEKFIRVVKKYMQNSIFYKCKQPFSRS